MYNPQQTIWMLHWRLQEALDAAIGINREERLLWAPPLMVELVSVRCFLRVERELISIQDEIYQECDADSNLLVSRLIISGICEAQSAGAKSRAIRPDRITRYDPRIDTSAWRDRIGEPDVLDVHGDDWWTDSKSLLY